MNVTFFSPPLGKTTAPLGFDGVGEVDATSDGIELRGPRRSSNIDSAFGLLGVGVGAGVAAAIFYAVVLMLGSRWPAGVAGAFGFIFTIYGAVLLGRRLFPGKQVALVVPWEGVKNLGGQRIWLVAGRGANSVDAVSFISRTAPKGQVFFVADGTSAADVVERFRRIASASGTQL